MCFYISKNFFWVFTSNIFFFLVSTVFVSAINYTVLSFSPLIRSIDAASKTSVDIKQRTRTHTYFFQIQFAMVRDFRSDALVALFAEFYGLCFGRIHFLRLTIFFLKRVVFVFFPYSCNHVIKTTLAGFFFLMPTVCSILLTSPTPPVMSTVAT